VAINCASETAAGFNFGHWIVLGLVMSFNAGRQKPNGSEDSTCPLDGLEQSDDCTPALNSENCPALEKG
jgi:hypothetical protein